jgi:hypothetical protein
MIVRPPASAARDRTSAALSGMPAKSCPSSQLRISVQVPQNRGVFKSIEITNVPDNIKESDISSLYIDEHKSLPD